MITLTKNIEEAKFITHSGIFHPDDVFSTAFLDKVFPNNKVIRVNKVEKVKQDQIVYDIGFGKFDHHGKDARWRNEKLKYSSFGLLWKTYGHQYLEKITPHYQDVWEKIDEKLVCQIDGIDNGNFPKIIADYELLDLDKVIDLYNKNWDSKDDNDEQFLKAVFVASELLDNLIKREISYSIAFKKVIRIINNTEGDILYLDEYMPYEEAIFYNNNNNRFKAIIYPANRGGFNIKLITISKESYELKYHFPEEWCGLEEKELINKSKIRTLRFIHSNGFIASTGTKEDAYLLCKNLK